MTDADLEFQSGVELLAQRRVGEALECLARAEANGADRDACAAQRWFCWMLLGEFELAWTECDAIACRNETIENCLWDGKPFDGNRVIVRTLHGFGDAVQFMRYLPLLRERASHVTVETHPELMALFRAQPYVDEVITWESRSLSAQDWEQQIEVMEFPRAFRTTIETIPHRVPYITVPRRRLSAATTQFRAGIVWAASGFNPERNIPYAALGPLFEVPGVSFYSFQHGAHAQELRPPLIDMAALTPDILDTASTFTQMDLVITVDTLAAHLAGALGCKVWTLLHSPADWRWMLEGETSPWYPSMRLFRQRSPGDWTELIYRVAQELTRTTRTVSAASSTTDIEARSIVSR
jgi:hypothetical protein